MNGTSLTQARRVWHALFVAGVPVESARWVAWADGCISASTDAPPEWLCSLAVASTAAAASAAVSEGIGLEPTTKTEPDSQALVIGFVVGRQLSGQISEEEMWSKLATVTDVNEFLDSGKWRRFFASEAASSPPQSPLQCLLPVARFANEQAALLLPAPRA